MINSKIDFNKVMFAIGVVLVVTFGVAVLIDYQAYDINNNSAPFYTYIIVRAVELLVPGLLFIWLYNENTHLKQATYSVKANLKENENIEYKIAQISDFHNTNSKRIKSRIIKALQKAKPNIIVITGDLIDSRRTNTLTACEFLKKITSIAPVYYVFGNHESRKKNIQEIAELFLEAGVNILRNENVELLENIELIGLDDVNFFVESEQRMISEDAKSKLKSKLCDATASSNKYKILITHRPELLDVYSSFNIDLVLTGHAHGGQMRLPFVGGLFAPGQGILPKYSKGQYNENKTTMIVSSGIGNSGFPFRINNKPELVIVNLV